MERQVRRMFEKATKEEFLASVDRSIEQIHSGQTFDAKEAVQDMASELEAGYKAMKAMQTANRQRRANA